MTNSYKFGNAREEREQTFKKIVELYEKNTSLKEIGKMYETSKQAVSAFLQRRGYFPRKEHTRIRNKKTKELLDKGILEEIKKIRKEKHDTESKLCAARANAHFYVTQLQGARKTMDKILKLVEDLIKEHERSGYYTLYSEAQDSIDGTDPENAYDHFYDVGRYDCLLRIRDDIKTLMEED